ncbi:MAG: glycosyltransferase family 2 protein [Pirellulales bacterium]|jgi:hypothetical protein
MTSIHTTDGPQVSLVIPIRNEAGNIGPLIEEIRTSLETAGFSWEILVINDGSTDGSAHEVESLSGNASQIHLIHLTDGRGKSAALLRGFASVRGKAVVMLDGDGQDDPSEIPKMLTQLGLAPDGQKVPPAEADLVNGWKTPRLDPWHKTMPSRVFNLLVSWLTNVSLHDHNCGLKAMRREVAQRLPLATGMHRFIPVLAAASGYRIIEQPVHHRPRTQGVSKYGVGRFFRGLFDLGCVWLKLQTGQLCTASQKNSLPDPTAGLRKFMYVLLALIACSSVLGRITTITTTDRLALEKRLVQEAVQRRTASSATPLTPAKEFALKQELSNRIRREKGLFRPFLSANDRSRWLTIRSLAERGTFAIEDLAAEPGWDTIDAVVHPDKNGKLHLYSSKPPLLSVLLAGPYWLLVQATGWTLGDHPFLLGRFMLVLYGLVPLGVTILASCSCIELIGTTDRGKIWSAATIAFGTLLTTFAVALTNHSFAAACTAISLYCVLVVTKTQGRSWFLFAAAGLTAGLAAAFDLPALAWTMTVIGILAAFDWRQTACATLPAVLIVLVAALGTNVLAHGSAWPPYAFRTAPTPSEISIKRNEIQTPVNQWNPENWYDYRFKMPNGRVVESYWRSPGGIDRGETSITRYAFHAIIGHHGIFSLTPVWLLVLPGLIFMLRRPGHGWQILSVAIIAVSVTVILFYLTRQPWDRNYGGSTSGFRWVFWLAPIWISSLTPAADRMAASRTGYSVLLLLLGLSVLSVAAPTWNPWTHPWLYQLFNYPG